MSIVDPIIEIMHPLLRKKRAYRRLFAGWNDRSKSDARRVLADLKNFADLPDSPLRKTIYGLSDPIESARFAGRQETVLRIVAMLEIDDRSLFNLTDETDD